MNRYGWKLAALSLAMAIGCTDSDSDTKKTDASASADSGASAIVTDAASATPRADMAASPAVDAPAAIPPGPDAPASDVAPKDGGGSDSRSNDGAASDAPAGDGGGAPAVVLTAEQERGRYLVNNVIGCPDCHTPRNAMGGPDLSKYMAGWECFVQIAPGKCLSSRNLTSDATGLGNRSAADIKKMFMDGIRPAATGDEVLNPIMPYYIFHNTKAEDADAIVAYLKIIPPVKHEIARRAVEFDVPAAAPPVDPATIPTVPDTYPAKASADRGRYLTTQVGVCLECHTKHEAPGPGAVIKKENFFAGGEMFRLGLPGTSDPVSRNITSDDTNGIGKWTTDDIIKVLKMGISKDGKPLCPPMPTGPMGPYGGLKDQDALDIANYIKSLPANPNKVVSMCVWPPGPPRAAPDGGLMMTPMDGGASDAASMNTSTDASSTDAQ